MRSKFIATLLLLCFAACKMQPGYTGAALEQKLKSTIQQHLYSDKNTDSTKVKYDITNLVYFDDSLQNKYICEFTVHMHIIQNNFDTTGTMKADVSKDFNKVTRLY